MRVGQSLTVGGDFASSSLDVDDRIWHDFVEGNPQSLIFHHPAWLRLLSDAYGYRVFNVVLRDELGRIVLGLPVAEIGPRRKRRWVSLPFSDRCAPLVSPDLSAPQQAAALEDLRRKQHLRRIEVHHQLEGPHAYSRSPAVFHLLELAPDAEAVARTSFRPQVRTHIRKAERLGLEVRLDTSREALTETFYNLHVRTRRRLGVPVQPRGFFEQLWGDLIAPGLGFVSLAFAGSEPLAGAVILTYNGTAFYKFAASESASLRFRPNHLVLARCIEWACTHGYRQFDFGRSDLPHRGLRAFKASWGAREFPLAYTTFADQPPRRHWFEASDVFAPFLRRAPEWTVRAAGELLYRYVGY